MYSGKKDRATTIADAKDAASTAESNAETAKILAENLDTEAARAVANICDNYAKRSRRDANYAVHGSPEFATAAIKDADNAATALKALEDDTYNDYLATYCAAQAAQIAKYAEDKKRFDDATKAAQIAEDAAREAFYKERAAATAASIATPSSPYDGYGRNGRPGEW
jgi:hypothetical protein